MVDTSTGYAGLAQQDPVMRGLITRFGRPDPFPWRDGGRTGTSMFAAMVLHIMGQHTTTIQGYRLYDRLAAGIGRIPRPDDVLDASPGRLAGYGIPPGKGRYLHDLARAQSEGTVDLDAMSGLDDGQVIARLTAVRGIGPWSAEMFLIHQLRRPDVIPAGDGGLRRATATAYGLAAVPAPAELRTRAAVWAPYRTFAAALLWRSLPFDPKEEALTRLPPPTYLPAATGGGKAAPSVREDA